MDDTEKLFAQSDCISVRFEHNPVECIGNDENRELVRVGEFHALCNGALDLLSVVDAEYHVGWQIGKLFLVELVV